MEAWYTSKGPMLIECNPRVGGGLINDIHQAVYGVDMTVGLRLPFFLFGVWEGVNIARLGCGK